MEIVRWLILVCALVCAAVFSGIIFNKLFTRIRKRNIGRAGFQSSSKKKSSNEDKFAWFFRNGIDFLKPVCKWLLEHIKSLDKLLDSVVLILVSKGYLADKLAVMSSFVLFVFLAAFLISLIFRSAIAGIAVVICSCVLIVTGINSYMDKKKAQLRNSIPDALRSMEACFQAGYTLLQTFDHLSEESKGSVKKLFLRSSNVLQTGGTISDALEILRKEELAPELTFIAVALDIQHQSGGSIKPVLESARDMVESKLELVRLLQVQTAQAKLSARVVTILPFALIAVFSLISPDFLKPFFSSFIGVVLFCIACLMQVAGVILVRKMLKVEV